MALETATYINGLVSTNPLGTDTKAQGDDHIRLLKSTVKATFPLITTPWNATAVTGTVSQSAGVPTGAIIETGSNAAGNYTKYADGTMICRGNISLGSIAISTAVGSIFQSALISGTGFAATFSAAPVCSVLIVSTNANVFPCTNAVASTTAISMYLLSAASGSQTITAQITAIGRWF